MTSVVTMVPDLIGIDASIGKLIFRFVRANEYQ